MVLIDDDPGNVAQARRCGWIGVHFDGRDTWRGQVHAALAAGPG